MEGGNMNTTDKRVNKRTSEIRYMLNRLYPKNQLIISSIIDSMLYCQQCEKEDKNSTEVYQFVSMT